MCVACDIPFHLSNKNENVLPASAAEPFEDGLSGRHPHSFQEETASWDCSIMEHNGVDSLFSWQPQRGHSAFWLPVGRTRNQVSWNLAQTKQKWETTMLIGWWSWLNIDSKYSQQMWYFESTIHEMRKYHFHHAYFLYLKLLWTVFLLLNIIPAIKDFNHLLVINYLVSTKHTEWLPKYSVV